MKAVYAGSFSPPTLGHMNIIYRAAEMFDEVIVAVLSQAAKKYLFSPEERMEMLEIGAFRWYNLINNGRGEGVGFPLFHVVCRYFW